MVSGAAQDDPLWGRPRFAANGLSPNNILFGYEPRRAIRSGNITVPASALNPVTRTASVRADPNFASDIQRQTFTSPVRSVGYVPLIDKSTPEHLGRSRSWSPTT